MTTLTANKNRIEDPITKFTKRIKKLDVELGKNLKKYIPDWWDEELNTSKSAVQQLLISLARFTNLDIKTVLDESLPLQFKKSVCNYKHATNKEQADLKAATALVASVSRVVSQLNTKKYHELPDALTLRKQLLEAGNSCVNFESLIGFCWEQGVPVLYLPELPASKKMAAVVVDIDGSPVISITRECKHESYFLFLLAHEMGHIFHKHLNEGQMLIDEKISTDLIDSDEQEKQANLFAIRLLTGKENTKFHCNGKWLKSEELARKAKSQSDLDKIDAGHIVLNWANTENGNDKKNVWWKIATKALDILYPNPGWKDTTKKLFIAHIDEDEAQGDQLDYLYKLMKIEE